jgi:DMSO reductase family type II enzyme chaperone
VDVALCRSVLWEALALGFRAPTGETVARLVAQPGVAALADAAAVLVADAGTGLASRVRRLAGLWDLRALGGSFPRLFGHTARGAVPPYETEYGEDSPFLPMHEMSDLAAFYRAFGLVLKSDAHERPDHIACECEFMCFLARKEAYALERADPAILDETLRAARLFLRDHLGRWAPAFGVKLMREDPDGFYGALGDLCHGFVSHECARLGVSVSAPLLRLRSPLPADTPMACGPASELPLIQP